MKLLLSHDSALEYWRLPDDEAVWLTREQASVPVQLPRSDYDPDYHPSPTTFSSLMREDGPATRAMRRMRCRPHTLIAGGRTIDPRIGMRVHREKASIPPGQLLHIGQDVYVCSPELTLLQACAQRGFIDALLLAYEFCGSYALQYGENLVRRQPLCTVERCERLIQQLRGTRMRGLETFERVLGYTLDGSASPKETQLALLVVLPQARGGYGLPRPELNRSVRLSSAAARILGLGHCTPDLSWPERKLAIEYDSELEHYGQGKLQQHATDSQRAIALRKDGWYVMSITLGQLLDPQRLDACANEIARILEVRKNPRFTAGSPGFAERQAALREALGL